MSNVPDRDRRPIKPTPKRIADFRKRGEIALSRDLTSVASRAAGAILGFAYARESLAEVSELFVESFTHLARPELAAVWTILARGMAVFAGVVLPVSVGGVVGFLVSAFVQLGSPPALVWPKLDLARPFSFAGFGQMVSPKQAAGRALKALGKLAFVGCALWIALEKEEQLFAFEPALTASALLVRMLSASARLAIWSGAALGLLALIDYAYSRREMDAKMRMTPDELKREMKEMDGDPHIRAKRRQRMRELARQRLSAKVKTADVVVVNPTEFAVALRYRSKEEKAPRVLVKGKKLKAQRIRDLARAAGIPILPQPPLARLLYKVVPEGREIPANLYKAVAEVLAYVYRLKKGRSR